jgi:hypothetical protein
MRRFQLFEIHEQRWFPEVLRDAVTDVLQFVLNLGQYGEIVAPLLEESLERAGTERIVDLCSGGGGPWPKLLGLLRWPRRARVCLTDRFPNLRAFEKAKSRTHEQLEFCAEPVDARRVPADLHGLRTLFNCFHHFAPNDARRIIADAARMGEGVAIFEVPSRGAAVLGPILMAAGALVFMPFVRPFRVWLFAATYLVPVIPFVMWFDGTVSCLRAYTPAELKELSAEAAPEGYEWKSGTVRRAHTPVAVTYLLGARRVQGADRVFVPERVESRPVSGPVQ